MRVGLRGVHQHVGSLFPLFLLAIGLAVAYEATGCLLVPIFMHATFNGISLLAMWYATKFNLPGP